MSPRYFVGQVVELTKINDVLENDGRMEIGDKFTVTSIYYRRGLTDSELKRFRLVSVEDDTIIMEVGEYFMRSYISTNRLRDQVSKLWHKLKGK